MTDDQTFRVVLAIGMLVCVPIALYHRLRSQASGERLDRRQEGLFVLLTLRLLGVATMAAIGVFIIAPASMAWSAMWMPVPVRRAGVAIGALAIGLLAWTLRTLGLNLTDTVVTRRDHTLVTTGPYRCHAFYVAVAPVMLGNGLAAAKGGILAAGAATVALLVVRCRAEEDNLAARFGDACRAYAARTGRFLPRLAG